MLRLENLKGTEFVVKSRKMQQIEHMAAIVAKVDSTVLLSGESGVGKGVISKFIHNKSNRREGPFIKIDCSAIPENLFESEVFGYEKGAFTGAERTGKTGLLELANGGTVFLDEIGDMPLYLQPKILRAIQDREIVKVGGKEVIPINVRFIAATNRDLKKMVEEKQFREDLFYRLNVVPIELPPLRERKEDIIPLIQNITQKINKRYDLNKSFTNMEIERMLQYDWPGNVRELENIIERAMVTEDGDLTLIQASSGISISASVAKGYREKLEEYYKRILLDSIKQEGSVIEAAEKLGIDATTIRRKLHKYKGQYPVVELELEIAIEEDSELLREEAVLLWFVSKPKRNPEMVLNALVSLILKAENNLRGLADALITEPERIGIDRNDLRCRLESIVEADQLLGGYGNRPLEALAATFPGHDLVKKAWANTNEALEDKEGMQRFLPPPQTYIAVAYAEVSSEEVLKQLRRDLAWMNRTDQTLYDEVLTRHLSSRLKRDNDAAKLIAGAIVASDTSDTQAAEIASLLAISIPLSNDILDNLKQRLEAQIETKLAPAVQGRVLSASWPVRNLLIKIIEISDSR